MRERDYIRWLREALASSYVGDDTAVVTPPGGNLLFTTDLLVEGTHFAEGTDPKLIGRKAVAASLSDIAAMGGIPKYAVLSVCLRRGCREDAAKGLLAGAADIAREFETEIVGGDTTSSESCFAVCVAMLGAAPAGGPVRRSGAADGDEILVTGRLGGSIGGGHLTFTPRVREAAAILAAARPSAMIDVSDGLATDLGHIVEESGVGAVLREEAVPLGEGCTIENALSDGEDYELLLTASAGEARKIVALGLECGVTSIGTMGGEGVRIAGPSGDERPAGGAGYEHEW